MTAQEGWAPPAHPDGPGWMVFDDEPERPVVVHFTRDGRGRWRADAIYIAAATLDSDALRDVSIPAYEARANDPRGNLALLEQAGEALRARAAKLGVDLPFPAVTAPKQRRTSARLKVPPGAKPDSFYKRVAEVYADLAAANNRPAVELAEANGVPLTTAHRWVKEARRRGFLPPGQKGRRG